MTVFYGVWEPETGGFRYAVGGHNPPLWARVDGTLQPLPGRGIALGVLDGVRYTEQQVVLARGEALLLYTDGLTDAVNNHNEEFGLERTFAVLRATQAATAEVILSTLAGAVQAHVGAREPFDDMTMVVLKHSN